MRDALVILNARDCAPARRAFNALDISKIWLTGYTERQLADGVFTWMLEESSFDRYIVCADDIIITPEALAAIQRGLDDGNPVVTGYSQRSHTDWTVNVTNRPLAGDRPIPDAYGFVQYRDVLTHDDAEVPTWFAGFSATGMHRDMWERFGFGCFLDPPGSEYGEGNGYASDFYLSRSLQGAGIPIVAMRESFCYHWRNEWQHTNHPDDDRLFVGKRHPEVIVENQGGTLSTPPRVPA